MAAHRLPLAQLSQGYQSVLALVVDIMADMHPIWPTMEVAEGIVLLDEIGAHLHPRWNMRIVGSLRKVFPRIQFLATTHNPLCLRELYDDEVVVLRRSGRKEIEAITDLPPVAGLRADQLLTSEYFGLQSTMDPDIEVKLNEYYRLLAVRQRSEAQDKRLQELKTQLEELDLMGETRRERLMLEAIDQMLAEGFAPRTNEKLFIKQGSQNSPAGF
jgi:predicted ATP-binding protein involved in virulence